MKFSACLKSLYSKSATAQPKIARQVDKDSLMKDRLPVLLYLLHMGVGYHPTLQQKNNITT